MTDIHTPLPWACAKGGDYDNESYIEEWIAIIPEGSEPKDKYEYVTNEIARVGAARWRYQVRHRDRPEEEDAANAAYIMQACNAYPELLKALRLLLALALTEIDRNKDTAPIMDAARAAIDQA